jgi:hypothetical protein
VDISRGEQVEGELDAMIRRRDEKRRRDEGERVAEGPYMVSTRRQAERQQLRLWWEWLRYHERMIRSHTANFEALISRHRIEAERYAALLGVEAIDETTKVNGHKKGRAA